jgi:archaellum component FlaF (FlaF/FlaG flagellin family)
LIELKLLNRKAIGPRMMGAAIILVSLLVGGGAVYIGQAFAYQNGQTVHVTGSWTAAIEYYLSENGGLVVPYPAGAGSAGQTMATHTDFGTVTGGMSGTFSLLLQGEGPLVGDTFYESWMGPFVGTVGRSAPGMFTEIGSAYVTNAGGSAPWTLYGTFSAVDGVNGLAGICGGGTWSGTTPPSATGLNGTLFYVTYDATFMFGSQCNNQQ